MIIRGGAPGEQLCWSEPWMRFSAHNLREVLRTYAAHYKSHRPYQSWRHVIFPVETRVVGRRKRAGHLRVRALCAERRSCFASALSVSRIAAALASMVPAAAG